MTSSPENLAMDCRRVIGDEIAEQYVAGRLPEDDQVAYEQHYFQCARCFEELKNYRALRADLERVSAVSHRQTRTTRRLLWVGAGTAAVLAISLLTLRQLGVLDRDVERAAPQEPAVEPPPPPSLAELGALGPPPYQPIAGGTPDPATRTFRDAMRDYERGDYAASAKGLAAAARLDPASPQIHFYLGASYLLSGDTAAAVAALQTTIDRGDSAYLEDARFYLAKALIRRGDLDEARAGLLKIASLKGDREREARTLLAALDARRNIPGRVDARIIKVDGRRAYINIGAANGVKVGDTFTIIHRGEQPTGTGVVIQVQERFAIIEVTGQAVAADVIKKM